MIMGLLLLLLVICSSLGQAQFTYLGNNGTGRINAAVAAVVRPEFYRTIEKPLFHSPEQNVSFSRLSDRPHLAVKKPGCKQIKERSSYVHERLG